ncbi:MAG TPA: Uma2 family endonuclease [Gemmataceae bacterium]|nr:Uma2 family endonuclease [Gemmataceae bacterium]
MTILSQPRSVENAANGRIQPLENGDRLTRPEFERRYAAMPHVKKAELIEGVVYMPSPVSNEHAQPHFDVIGWLAYYRAATPGISGGDNGTLRLDLDNEPQPDAFLRILAEHGGQARVDDDGYVSGAPELVVEVARSSVNIDLHAKLHAYRRNGVREYLVWRVLDQAIDWFVLREGRYEPLAPAADGLYRSEVLPGLRLDAAALLRGDLLTVLQTVQRGLDSSEHAAFVRRLQQTAAQGRS